MNENLLDFAQELETRGAALVKAAQLVRAALAPTQGFALEAPPAAHRALPAPAKKTRTVRKARAKVEQAPEEKSDRKKRRARIVALIAEGKDDQEIARLTGASASGVYYIRKHPPKPAKETAPPRQ